MESVLANHCKYNNESVPVKKFVIDRLGNRVPFSEDRILNRLIQLKQFITEKVGRRLDIEISNIWRNFKKSFKNNCSTYEIDQDLADSCAKIRQNVDPDYDLFAAQILVNNIVRQLKKHYNVETFRDYIRLAQSNVNFNTGQSSPLLSDDLVRFYEAHADRIESKLSDTYKLNYLFSYPAIKTMIKGQYFLCIFKSQQERVPIEIPSYMFMRLALGLCQRDIEETLRVYDMFICQLMIPSSPTIYSAGTPNPHLASCFLLGADDDLDNQFKILNKCAQISKQAGGIGLHIHDIRSEGSYIASANGTSKGIVPYVQLLQGMAVYVDQAGKRNGSLAVYLEPNHADFEKFIVMKDPERPESLRAHHLNYGLWVPDLFMKRYNQAVENKRNGLDWNIMWSFMNPQVCPGLSDVYGEEYEELYESYESKGMFVKQVPILDVMAKIKLSQSKTGQPYFLNKDECNRKSNQKNQGTIRSSNLCTEIIQYSHSGLTATCNLISVNLKNMIKFEDGQLVPDLDLLQRVVKMAVIVENCVIDVNHYPCEDAKRGNMDHRPIGVGIQGLASWFQMLGIDIESKEGFQLNSEFAEAMLYAAYDQSCTMAEVEGKTYSSFEGSPLSYGIFHHEMWKHEYKLSSRLALDWEGLRSRILRHGTKNSLLICHMPTATGSILLDNTPSFELPKFILYTQVTRNGKYFRWCRPLVSALKKEGLWNDEMYQKLLDAKYTIQNISDIPEHIRKSFKTNYDISSDNFLDLNRDRAMFVDQGISLNVDYYLTPDRPTLNEQMDNHLLGCFKRGMKNYTYYTKVIKPSEHLSISKVKTSSKLNKLRRNDMLEQKQKVSILDIGQKSSVANKPKRTRMLRSRRLRKVITNEEGVSDNVVDSSEDCQSCGA